MLAGVPDGAKPAMPITSKPCCLALGEASLIQKATLQRDYFKEDSVLLLLAL